ncbi:MAG TPA: RdgB/HAM1 family non-canonical purine NTP pyrophosphatase [Thermomicrobiales bacterium]|nr:RdgB/HAM1 family non-canonical purine NTP pyrophosphatase [Thermomicrobiales bacterium]
MTDLLLASNNKGKLRQLRSLLPADVIVASMADFGLPEPVEDGATFGENAAIKAIAGARATGLLTLADDSGLLVEALNGEPGVRSARYAGDSATDAENISLLLARMEQVPPDQRQAKFACVLALAQPTGVLASETGVCTGTIGFDSRGTHGFGYDPVFVLPDGRTMAEISPEEKNLTSHRGLALKAMLPAILIAIGTYRFAGERNGQ